MKILNDILDVLKDTLAGRWSEDALTDNPPQMDLTSWVITTDCGTTACILGHAMLDPRCQYLVDPGALKTFSSTDKPMLIPGPYAYTTIAGDTFGHGVDRLVAERLYAWLFMPSQYPHTDQRSLLAVTTEFERRVDLLQAMIDGSAADRGIFLRLMGQPCAYGEAIDFLEAAYG